MILVTGGARSGKSTFAENYVKKNSELNEVIYLATSIAFDDSMRNRIRKHRESRPSEWHTIEQYKNFKSLKEDENFRKSKFILLDCLTLLISNLLLEYKGDFDKITEEEIDQLEKEIELEIDELLEVVKEKEVIIVTNEVGLGLVPAYKMGSVFRDIAGRINQKIAKESTEVYLLVSGIEVKIKDERI